MIEKKIPFKGRMLRYPSPHMEPQTLLERRVEGFEEFIFRGGLENGTVAALEATPECQRPNDRTKKTVHNAPTWMSTWIFSRGHVGILSKAAGVG